MIETNGAISFFDKLPNQLSAFRHRNYRLFFFGQVISLTGTWLQSIALSWLIIQITDVSIRSLILGISGAISAAPTLFFSIPSGLIIDRFNKRNIIIITQFISMLLAFILSVLAYLDIVSIYHIFALGFVLGSVNALDAPARQSFVVDMVGKDDLANAITLNSAMFNSARIIGPAVAGIVIAFVGVAGAFALNGISFIAVIIGLFMMNISYQISDKKKENNLKEGFQYILNNKLILSLLILISVISIFASSFMVLIPIFANDILKLGAKEFGYLMAAAGVGAIIGAITLSCMGDFEFKGKMLLTANITYCLMLVFFSFSKNFMLSLILLVGVGWGMMIGTALINTIIQSTVSDELRGRVMSYYTMMFIGMAPIGSLQIGLMAHWVEAPMAVRISALISLGCALILSPRFFNYSRSD